MTPPSLTATQLLRAKLLPLASRHKDLTFALSSEERYATELQTVGLDDSPEDVNAAIYTASFRCGGGGVVRCWRKRKVGILSCCVV